MSIYNLIEYSDNYSDMSSSLWSFKSDQIVNNANVTNDDNAPSFKQQALLVIQETMEEKMDKNRCTIKIFK